MTQTLHVRLAERSYPIYIGGNLDRELRAALARLRADGRRAVIIADAAVARKHAKWLGGNFGVDANVLTLAGSEKTKSASCLDKVWQWLAKNKLDRHGAIFALGGGVIGDLAGFAAASYLRGVDFYQIPTSLLAMVDSSVGGKTGINLRAGKNLVGAFWQPRAVFVDMRFLGTLPPREFACGMAEIIKYGLLGDAKLFAQLEDGKPWNSRHPALPAVIHRCCALKAKIVGDDEREMKPIGGRALLNLGHTFGHALENATSYSAYKHGEAVGLGLVLAARLSRRLRWIVSDDVSRVEQMVLNAHLPVRLKRPVPVARLLEAMKSDKKIRGGKLRFVALRAIGRAVTVDGVPESLVRELWREVGAN